MNLVSSNQEKMSLCRKQTLYLENLRKRVTNAESELVSKVFPTLHSRTNNFFNTGLLKKG